MLSVFNTCFIMKIDSVGNEINMVRFSGSSSLANSICINDSNQDLFSGAHCEMIAMRRHIHNKCIFLNYERVC